MIRKAGEARHRGWLAAALSVLLAGGAALAAGDKPPLPNGGFEQLGPRKNLPLGWMTVYPFNVPTRPSFARDTEVKRAGKASGRITCPAKWGYVSWTQLVPVPAGTKTAILTGSVRTALSEGFASLALMATDGNNKMVAITDLQAASARGNSDWQARTLHLAIPEKTARLFVRGGIHGKGTAWFDELSLKLSEKTVRPTSGLVVFAEMEGAYSARSKVAAERATATLSLPGPFEGQMPVEYEVWSRPDGKIRQWAILAEGENRFVKITLKPLKRGENVALQWRCRLLLRERGEMFGLGVSRMPLSEKVPPALRAYLRPAKGIELASDEVRAAVKALKISDPGDFRSVIAAVSALLKEHLKFAGGTNQGAAQSLRNGKAVCTGYANVACALLRAKGIPTRILANTITGTSAQEHYIVECHLPRYGWVRYESTQRRFPVPDTGHIIVRVVQPDHPRSPINVPLYWKGSEGIFLNARMAFGSGNCWQRSEVLARDSVANADGDLAWGVLKKFWATQEGKPIREKDLSARARITKALPSLLKSAK